MKSINLKFTFIFSILIIFCLCFVSCNKKKNSTNTVKIGVSKIISHSSLDAAEKGMEDYLNSKGLNVKIDYQNANGDISSSASIAQKFKNDKIDIAVGVATPTAQALTNVFNKDSGVPVVFMAVTDPVDAGLVTSWNGDASSNVCGVSDNTPVFDQVSLLVRLTGAKRIGNIYCSGEANGVILKDAAQDACKRLGVEFVSVAVANTSEVKQAALSIIDRVDAVYIATDNVVHSAIPSVDDVCVKARKPLFVADPTGVEELNCLVAWGFNYYNIGLEAGKLIEKIINGENPGTLGTVSLTEPKDFELWLNLDVANNLGIKMDNDLINSASHIIRNNRVER